MSPRRFAPRVLALLPVGLFLFTLVLGWPLTAQQADNPTLPPPVVPDGFRGVQPTDPGTDAVARYTDVPPATPQPQPLGWHLIFEDGFDGRDPQPGWVSDLRPYLVADGDNRRLDLSTGRSLPLGFGFVHDSLLQVRARILRGSLLLGARNSDLGQYTVEFRADGLISLFRSDTLLASTTAAQDFSREALVGVRVIGNRVSALVDSREVLAITDDALLPYGITMIGSSPDASISLDDVRLEGTIDDEPDIRIAPPQPDLSRTAIDTDNLIAYYVVPGYDIYVIDPAGTVATQITSGSAFDTDPSWSADRRKIAFMSSGAGGYSIRVYDFDTNTITDLLTEAYPMRPRWSPSDDAMMVYDAATGIDEYGNHSLYLYDTVTETSTFLVQGNMPNWSPSGDRIVYHTSGFNLLRIKETGTSQPYLQLEDTGYYADWSSAGELSFTAWGEIGRLMSPEDTSASLIFDGSWPGIWPMQTSWSPDAEALVLDSPGYYDEMNSTEVSGELYLVSRDGGTPVNITNTAAVDEVAPDWGPLKAVCGGQRQVCQIPTVVFMTNTPQGPTQTPTAGPTLSDAELATVFPLPIYSPLGTPEARLVGTPDFVDRAYEAMLPTARLHVTPLCSRDANPAYSEAGQSTHALIAGARAEIWFTSTLNNVGANENLGQFTVLRIRIQDLPQGVRDRLIASVHSTEIAELISAAATTSKNVGWLYIAYAHQSFISLDIIRSPRDVPPYPVVEPTVTIGGTGNSGIGGGSTNKHLDVSAYYVSGPVNDVNGITIDAEEPDIRSFGQADYSTYFRIYQSPGVNFGFGAIELIDPLTVWPLLGNGVTNVDTECP